MRLTTADGVEIAYQDSGGDGEPTLFLHGITECTEVWRPVLDRLGERRIISLDLRGHGASGPAEHYDLGAMAADVGAVLDATGTSGSAHLVGHSLGAMIATAVGAAVPVASIVNVDQSLRLGDFKAQLTRMEAELRDPATFAATLDAHFAKLAGERLPATERARLQALRRVDPEVVLGIWALSFSSTETELNGVVEDALAGYAGREVPYLTIFGEEPEAGYDAWLRTFVACSNSECWPGHGHHPHLVDPDRFVDRLRAFWG